MSKELKDVITELNLTAIYEEAEEGGYIAVLPGANTQGETLGEVRMNLEEAARMILNSYSESAAT